MRLLRLTLIALLVATVPAACGENTADPTPTGAVEVSTSTTGGSLDPDGYTIDVAGRSRTIGVNDEAVIDDLPSGSVSVRLSGIAANCDLAGTNPRTIVVGSETNATVSFAVTCSPIGSITVTTATSGGDLDPDGYSVSVASLPPVPIGIDETHDFPGIDAGSRTVVLAGLADNCVVLGENPRTVDVPVDQGVSTLFEIDCVAPLSNQIVFFSDRDGDFDIYAMNDDGSNPTNLTDDHPSDTALPFPAVSPDGRSVAFGSNRDGQIDIFVMDAGGRNVRRLTDHPDEDSYPNWSPDGQRILFSRYENGPGSVFVMNADGSGQTGLPGGSSGDNAHASFSPDGSKIVFTSSRDGSLDIFVMNADGTEPMNLTNHPARDEEPDWSPDGERILFTSARTGDSEIFVMNADGSNPVNLTQSPGSDELIGGWSPDGSRIVFYSNRDGDGEVYVMNADGTGQVNLTNDPSSADVPGGSQSWR